MADPARAEQWRRLVRRSAVAFTAANLTGGIVTFVFLGFVVPVPAEVANDWGRLWLNVALFVPVAVTITVVANLRGRRRARAVGEWYVAGREPDARERELTLRQPLLQTRVSAGLWAMGTLPFVVLNAFGSWRMAALVAFAGLLGGLASSGVTYLLGERLSRDVIAVALRAGVPEEPVGPGVATRIFLAWALAAGIPLLGGMLLSLAVLTGADVSADQVAGPVLFLGVVGLIVGWVSVRMAARSVADPLEDVRAALRGVEAGDLTAAVPVYDGSEVGLLQAGFNRMADGLRERERLRDLFGRHVGRDVARRALERGVQLGGEARECGALFVDLLGSTALAATRPPAEVVEILNRFFSVVVEVTHGRGGWVNKFEGDAALCVFGAPEDPGGAPDGALAAARELSARLRRDVPEVRAAIGVSWGPVVAGNVGAAERFEYTVIGDPVNEAARLCELAKERESRLLASARIVEAASEVERARWRLGEPVVLRGRNEPTVPAEPVDDAPAGP